MTDENANITEPTEAPEAEQPKLAIQESLRGAVFEEVDLDCAVFHNDNLFCTAIVGCNINECRIEESSMENAQFRNLGMKHASYQAADLHGAVFTDVNLIKTTIKHSAMQESHFVNMNLSDSAYQNCSFEGAHFNNCDWEEATIDGIPVRDMISAYMELHNF